MIRFPTKAPKFCTQCKKQAVAHGRCEEHQRAADRLYNAQRDPLWMAMYRSARWCGPAGLRQQQLRREPLCRVCREQDRLTPANTVDHVVPHRGDPELFFDASNLQSLCVSCHSKKTDKEDGGFGNHKK